MYSRVSNICELILANIQEKFNEIGVNVSLILVNYNSQILEALEYEP